jgi:hypothetical protein
MGVDGLGESHAAFTRAHHENSAALLNLAEGRKKDAPRPAYDPNHPDNQWPVMLHHPAKGELTVGRSLKGISNPAERKAVTATNEEAVKAALKLGYRSEPYAKPQITVLDPAAEKAALVKQNEEVRGQLAELADKLAKLEAAAASEAK